MDTQMINIAALPKTVHCHAVRAGSLMYTTGQLGKDPKTSQVLDGIEAQTRQALTNLKTLVESQGLTLQDVVKITIYVTDIKTLPKLNEVYFGEFFPEYRPARTCVEVSKIGADALLELDAVVAC